jgi:hypothetical protein
VILGDLDRFKRARVLGFIRPVVPLAGLLLYGLPAPTLQADSFGPLTVPLAALLPELRRKESSAELKAKAEKTSAAIYFDYRYPGTGILANEDARKFMEIKERRSQIGTKEIHRNT